MSLDGIQLPPIVLQALFTTSLVHLAKETVVADSLPASLIQSLGNNRQHVTIVISNDETLYLPDNQLNFLLGILSACGLSMDDVAIVNIKKNISVSYTLLETELSAEKIFLFDVLPSEIDLPLSFPSYQVQRFNNQLYLTAPSLSSIQDDKAEKTKLWDCLQQIFSI